MGVVRLSQLNLIEYMGKPSAGMVDQIAPAIIVCTIIYSGSNIVKKCRLSGNFRNIVHSDVPFLFQLVVLVIRHSDQFLVDIFVMLPQTTGGTADT